MIDSRRASVLCQSCDSDSDSTGGEARRRNFVADAQALPLGALFGLAIAVSGVVWAMQDTIQNAARALPCKWRIGGLLALAVFVVLITLLRTTIAFLQPRFRLSQPLSCMCSCAKQNSGPSKRPFCSWLMPAEFESRLR